MPQKRFYRQRAHANPIADHCFDYPKRPDLMNWRELYPAIEKPVVRFLDIGCGYGGLVVELAQMFPDKLVLGLEIRVKVSDYVQDRISALRKREPGRYQNAACIRSNAMKYLPNFFEKAQLEKLFFLFPDPHFKKAKQKWRVINETLLAEYAYVLAEVVGRVYTCTDVEELHNWMTSHLERHPLFERLTEEEMSADPIVEELDKCTEESQKVARANGKTWKAVFRRIKDPFFSSGD